MIRQWLALLCGITAVAAYGQQRPARRSMELELKMRKTQFIVKESLRVEVIFHNRGAAPATLPAVADSRNRTLSYHVTGPSFEKEFVFDYGSSVSMPIPGGPATVTVAPGSQASAAFPLEKRAKEWKPGLHTLRAVLDWNGEKVQSNVLSFDILEPEVKAGQVTLDAVPSSNMRVLFMASAGGKSRLYQGFFTESRPGLETNPDSSFTEAFEVPSATSAVVALGADFDRSMVAPRHVWISGHTVAVQEFQAEPISFDLGDDHLLRPGLMSHDADALFVSWHGVRATLTSVPRKGPPSRVWQATLPLPASTGRVWLTPAGKVTAVFVASHEHKISLFLVQDGKVIATTVIEKALELPDSEPGLAIGSDGTIRASLLVADPEHTRAISIVDWQWNPQEAAGEPKRQPAVNLMQDPRAAAAVYSLDPGVPRRDWVILYGNGSDIVVTSRSPTKPRMLNGTPLAPLQLLPRSQMSYLLLKHPKDVVYLTPMY